MLWESLKQETLKEMTDSPESRDFSRIDNTEHKIYDFDYDVDPENHVFKNTSDNCKYYTDDLFNDNVVFHNSFSLIHFNCRSLYKNFEKINEYLNTFKNTF